MDAVLIRMAIVPSLMYLFGKANWWFPGWLDRILPHVSVDPELEPNIGEPDGPAGLRSESEPRPGLTASV